MGRMKEELDKRLDENKYELLEALKYVIRELDKAGIVKRDSIFMEYPRRILREIGVWDVSTES